MQIKVEIAEDAAETTVSIKCRERDAFIERLVAALQIIDKQIMVTCDGSITTLNLEKILYLESVDRRCFVYTSDHVYEAFQKLYELQQQLEPYFFVRINKSCVVNIQNIDSIKTYIDRRLIITLSNGEQLIVSRQYANEIKALLGVK